MKSFKKLLAVVLSLAMVLGSLTVTALAANNEASVTIGTETTEYATLADAWKAVNSATGEATVKMLTDATASSVTTITQSAYPVTLDLNGKTITSTGQFLKINNTTKAAKGFTIEDTSEDGTGKIVSEATSISNGLIYNNTAADLIINGGTFETAQTGGYLLNASGYKAANIITNGGTFKAAGAKLVRVNSSNVTINAGTFYGDPTSTDIVQSATGTKTITGTVKDNGDGTWTVVAAEPVCEIEGGNTYPSLAAAVSAASSGDTIKMLAKTYELPTVVTVDAGKEITFDLNGCAITQTSTETGSNARCFQVKGTLNITDSEGSGSITGSQTITTYGGIVFVNGGNLNISGGTFYESTGTSNWYIGATAGGTISVTGGWFTDSSLPASKYFATGYAKVTVSDESKSATPYTVSNTTKTITYLKNATDASGSVSDQTYAYIAGYKCLDNTRSFGYTRTGYECMGWSTDKDADPDSTDLLAAGEVVNFSQYEGSTITLYAIWKKVDHSMWVCVDSADPTIGYASLGAAAEGSSEVTLIKNVEDRQTINGDLKVNLNGYNIVANTADNPTGSAIVAKANLSIYNYDAGTITVDEQEYKFGGEGRVEGYAQGTGGAIDSNGSNACVKIYGGTYTGDAPSHGTVLVCSSGGQIWIYGGTITPTNMQSTVETIYTGAGTVNVLGGVLDGTSQSDVKIYGAISTYSAASGTVGVAGGWLTSIPGKVTVGTWDETNGQIKADASKSIIANTGDATYPYSVGATPWKITYELDGGTNAESNPATVAKDDTTAITLQPATKNGYTFTGWTDASGNAVTSITGKDLTSDITLTANYEIITYTITYANLYDATNENATSYTVEDTVTLVDAVRSEDSKYLMSKWTLTDAEGAEISGWLPGGQTGDITLWANWATAQARVNGVKYKTMADAVEAAKAVEGTATIKLLKDLKLTERLDLRNGACSDFVIDLNGNNITKSGYTNSGLLIYAGNMTITGSGTVTDDSTNTATSGNRSIMCQDTDATLTIEGGTYVGFVKATTNASKDNPGAGAVIVEGTFSFVPGADNTNSSLKEGSVIDTEKSTETAQVVYVAAASVTTTTGETTYYKFMYSSDESKCTFDHITDGSTVKLYKDASSAHKFSENMTFTLNLNGFKYEKAATETEAAKGLEDLLTAADGHEIFFSYSEDNQVVTISIKDAVTYNITYVLGDGTNDPANPATYTATTPTITLKDAIPTLEGYAFQGWYDAAEGGNRVTEIAKGSTGDITLYARYSNTAVATVVVDGTTKAFVSIAAAVEAALANPVDGTATITLTGNQLDDTLTIGSTDVDVVIKGASTETKVAAPDGKAFMSVDGAEVTVDESVTAVLPEEANAIKIESGLLTFKGYWETGFTGAMFTSKGVLMMPDESGTDVVVTDPFYVDQQASAAAGTTVGAILTDSINPLVYFNFAPAYDSSDQPSMKVTINGETKVIEAERVSQGLYKVQLTSITPNQMAEKITFTPVIGDTEIGKAHTSSVLDYVEQLAETQSSDTTLMNLLADLTSYGSELQKYMNEGTAFDVPASLTSYIKTFTPAATDSVKKTMVSATDKNFVIKSASLNIDTKVSLFFVVYSTDPSAVLRIVVNNDVKYIPLTQATVITSMGDNYYRVQTDAFTALQYGNQVYAGLVDSTHQNNYHVVSYSVNSYCYAMNGKTLTSTALTSAIFNYGKAAEAFEAAHQEK